MPMPPAWSMYKASHCSRELKYPRSLTVTLAVSSKLLKPPLHVTVWNHGFFVGLDLVSAQLLDLSQYIVFFALHLVCTLSWRWWTYVLAWVYKFYGHHSHKQPMQVALVEWKEWPEKLWPFLTCLLWQPHAVMDWPIMAKMFHQINILIIIYLLCLLILWCSLIIVDSAQHCAVLENWNLYHCKSWFSADALSSHKLTVLLQASKQISKYEDSELYKME